MHCRSALAAFFEVSVVHVGFPQSEPGHFVIRIDSQDFFERFNSRIACVPFGVDDSSAVRALSMPIPACYIPRANEKGARMKVCERALCTIRPILNTNGRRPSGVPNRLRAIMQQLEQSGTAARVTRIEPRKAEDEWITQ